MQHADDPCAPPPVLCTTHERYSTETRGEHINYHTDGTRSERSLGSHWWGVADNTTLFAVTHCRCGAAFPFAHTDIAYLDEATPRSFQPFTFPLIRKRKILAGEACAPDIRRSNVLGTDLSNVRRQWYIGPVGAQDLLAERVDLALENDLAVRSFEPEIESADPGEKGRHAQLRLVQYHRSMLPAATLHATVINGAQWCTNSPTRV